MLIITHLTLSRDKLVALAMRRVSDFVVRGAEQFAASQCCVCCMVFGLVIGMYKSRHLRSCRHRQLLAIEFAQIFV